MYLYECRVHHPAIGYDTYTVMAKNTTDAYIELKRRLRDENPYPIEEWSTDEIICCEDCARPKRKWWQFWK
jgi:hypothetical protein